MLGGHITVADRRLDNGLGVPIAFAAATSQLCAALLRPGTAADPGQAVGFRAAPPSASHARWGGDERRGCGTGMRRRWKTGRWGGRGDGDVALGCGEDGRRGDGEAEEMGMCH